MLSWEYGGCTMDDLKRTGICLSGGGRKFFRGGYLRLGCGSLNTSPPTGEMENTTLKVGNQLHL